MRRDSLGGIHCLALRIQWGLAVVGIGAWRGRGQVQAWRQTVAVAHGVAVVGVGGGDGTAVAGGMAQLGAGSGGVKAQTGEQWPH